DGIRDLTVTGVQTCALPISDFGEGGRVDLSKGYDRAVQGFRWNSPPAVVKDVVVVGGVPAPATDVINENVRAVKEAPPGDFRGRSEERRVGKEGWSERVGEA